MHWANSTDIYSFDLGVMCKSIRAHSIYVYNVNTELTVESSIIGLHFLG